MREIVTGVLEQSVILAFFLSLAGFASSRASKMTIEDFMK